ncbi:MAG TPA: hypothetical protein VE553_06375, partial [Candidatus Binatia bacterium]|nr:hypothetical protein [Candidatus Binatia bacterium]
MTKLEQSLTTGQDLIVGREHAAAVGVTVALLLFLVGSLLGVRPASAQVQNGISAPESGAVLSGVVIIRGTASHESFLRYELAFSNGSDWLVFAEGDQPVENGTLAIWDTTVGQPANAVFPDGVYQLRLRVVRQDYNYDEYFVRNLTLSNASTPTPTATATTAELTTPLAGTPAAAASPTSGLTIIRPTPLPSLTPFPTPSRQPTPVQGALAGSPPGVGSDQPGDDGRLLQRLGVFGMGRFSTAFWAGARITLYAFALLALYLLLR